MTKSRSPKPRMASTQSPADNLTPEQQQELRVRELKNKERAYIAASRRSDRSLDKRIKSAFEASAVHKELTGKGLKITPEIVKGDLMYDEEEDARTRAAHCRHYASYPGHPQLGFPTHQHPVDEEFARVYSSLHRRFSWTPPMQETPTYSRDFRPSFAHYPSQHRPYVAQATPSYDIRRTRVSPVRQIPQAPSPEHPARYRRASAGSLPLHQSPHQAPIRATVTHEDTSSPFSNPPSNSSLSASPNTEPEIPSPPTPAGLINSQQFPVQIQADSPVIPYQADIPNDYVIVEPQNFEMAVQQLMDPLNQFDDLGDFNFSMPSLENCQYPDAVLAPSAEPDYADLVNWDILPEGAGPTGRTEHPS